MKIKKSELKQIIQEEIETVLTEKGKIKPQTPEHKAAIKKVDPEMPIDEPPRAEKAWLNRGVIDYDDDGTVKGRGGRNESQDQLYQMVQEELEAVLDEAGGTWDPVQAKEKTMKARARQTPPDTGDADLEDRIMRKVGDNIARNRRRRVYKEGLMKQMVQETLQAVIAERNR